MDIFTPSEAETKIESWGVPDVAITREATRRGVYFVARSGERIVARGKHLNGPFVLRALEEYERATGALSDVDAGCSWRASHYETRR